MSKIRKHPPASARRGSPSAVPGILLVAGLLLALAGLAWALFNALAGSQSSPHLAVDQKQIDFGNVQLDQPVTATFILTNQGNAPLRFSQKPWVELKEGC